MPELISQAELDELLQGLTNGSTDRRTAVSQYDFREMVRLSPQDRRSAEDAMQHFCVAAARSLSGLVGRGVLMSLRHLEEGTCEEFLANLPDPPILAVVSCSGMLSHVLWEIDPSVAYVMLDCVTGGEGAAMAPPRPASEIELALFARLIREGIVGLVAAWPELRERRIEVRGVYASPAVADLMAPQEHVLTAQMHVRVIEAEGRTSLCLPAGLVRQMLGRDRDGPEGSTDGASPEAALRRVPLEVVARLGACQASLSAVARLAPGDVIPLDRAVNEPIELLVNGSPKLLGAAGVSRGRLAVQVTGTTEVAGPRSS
jgi:flagellar motor switch protein FliM